MTCKPDHDSHHAGHVSLSLILHFAAKHQASLKMPCCIAISQQHIVSSVAMMLCCLAKMSCCSAGLEDLQRCFDHKEEGGGSEASASCLPSFLHCCLLHCPQSCRRHHHTQLPAGHPSIHSMRPSIRACVCPSVRRSICPFMHPTMHSCIQSCIHPSDHPSIC